MVVCTLRVHCPAAKYSTSLHSRSKVQFDFTLAQHSSIQLTTLFTLAQLTRNACTSKRFCALTDIDENPIGNSRGGHLRPQTGVLLKCEICTVAGTGNNQAQFTELIAPELDCCQSRQKCLIARGMNPTFHHQSVISYHQLTRFV